MSAEILGLIIIVLCLIGLALLIYLAVRGKPLLPEDPNQAWLREYEKRWPSEDKE